MWRLLKRNKERSEGKALDKTFEIINLRESLRSIHNNRTQQAIDSMEVALDAAVTILALNLGKCRASTKGLIECELEKLWLYRRDSPRRSANWLHGQDPVTRDRLIDMKARAEEILRKYKTR